MRQTALLFILILASTGCTKYMTRMEPEWISPQSMKYNKIYEVSLGSTMVMEERIPGLPAYKGKKNIKLPNFGVVSRQLEMSDIYVWYGTIMDDRVLCHAQYYPKSIEPTRYCIVTDTNGRVTKGHLNRTGYTSYIIPVQGEWKDKDIFVYTGLLPMPSNDIHPNSDLRKRMIKKELIYSGCSKDHIKISYREFINDLARPAFYQELIYEKSSNKISFQKMIIEVIEASNQSIKFKVIEGKLLE